MLSASKLTLSASGSLGEVPTPGSFLERLTLSVRISSVPYGDNVYNSFVIINRVDNAIITNLQSPQIPSGTQFDTVPRSWMLGQAFNPREYPVDYSRIQGFKLPSRRSCKGDGVLSH
jgi:hypothetical protein